MPVKIERVKNRIHITAPYRIARLKESVPGANFSDKPVPHWTAPLTMDSCKALREKFGETMEIGPGLRSWAWAERLRTEELAALGKQTDAEVRYVDDRAPALGKALSSRTYQRVAARFIERGRNVLIGDHPGLGKTLEALSGLVESDVTGDVLVLCPKTAIEAVWGPEIDRWLPGTPVVRMPDGRAKREGLLSEFFAVQPVRLPGSLRFVVANVEMVRTKSTWVCKECGSVTPVTARRKELVCGDDPRYGDLNNTHEYPALFDRPWAAVIIDESQNALIRRKGIDTLTRRGMTLLPVAQDGLRIALSGTPYRSRPQYLWGTLNWLEPQKFTSYWNWAATYFEIIDGDYAKEVGGIRRDKEQDLWRSLDGIVLRRTKAEVASDLPPKQYVGEDHALGMGVWLPMEPAQAKAYKEMLETSIAILEGGELNAIGVLAEMTRLKQFANSCGRMQGEDFCPSLPSNKFNYLLQMLEERGITEGQPTAKIVVASQFTETLEMFRGELIAGKHVNPRELTMITGRVTGKARALALAEFNRPVGEGPHVMFLNTKAGGVAITIDSADEMVILDETWVDDDQEQLEDRIHRVSNPRPVWYHYLRSLGSIEEAIAMKNASDDEVSHRLLDGRRGLAYATKVLDNARALAKRK